MDHTEPAGKPAPAVERRQRNGAAWRARDVGGRKQYTASPPPPMYTKPSLSTAGDESTGPPVL